MVDYIGWRRPQVPKRGQQLQAYVHHRLRRLRIPKWERFGSFLDHSLLLTEQSFMNSHM